MIKQAREIRYFFFSQHFSDGLQITAAVLLPALAAFYLNQFALGFTFSLGAVCVSITDAPGPVVHRRNSMLFTIFFIFAVALVTGYAQAGNFWLGLELLVFSFLFSLFSVYGNRAAGVGSAALLMLIFTMDKDLQLIGTWTNALFSAAGGLWYLLISLLIYQLRPYRPAQRMLGDCIREMAAYLSIRGNFYDTAQPLESNYRRMVEQQIVVSQKQDAVRELFFKTRRIVSESTPGGIRLLRAFSHSVDLFEHITATYYDYKSLRQRFETTGILQPVSALIQRLAAEIDTIGIAIQSNTQYTPSADFGEDIRRLNEQMKAIEKKGAEESTLILKRILVNFRHILQNIAAVAQYFGPAADLAPARIDRSRFIEHQSLDPKILWSNLSPASVTFRHAVKVALACSIGFLVAKWLAYGQHSYWILLTIAFILKPAFGLTRQRNIERILGTLLGGGIGVAALFLVRNPSVQFGILVVLMVGAYSFLRTRYFAMVVFTTAYVIILFQFLGIPFISVAQERVLDTVIGCAIAFSVSYFLFPVWESDQLQNFMADMLKANAAYLHLLVQGLGGKDVDLLDYKLARKNVYVSSANLTASYQRMLSEPRSKQKNKADLNYFIVLNHILFSNIATLFTIIRAQQGQGFAPALAASANRSLQLLCESVRKLDADCRLPLNGMPTADANAATGITEDPLLQKQLDFLYSMSSDIAKKAEAIRNG